MDFKNVPKKYRPVPFWSWNEKLNTEETKRQVAEMSRIGMGGFFMHARGGLQTEYMGEEWFENISAAVDMAEKTGLSAWAYDENGWPSGFGNGVVNSCGVYYMQKYICREQGEKQTEETLANIDGMHYFYKVNPFYVDTLDGKVTQKFIDEIYNPYYEKYKNRIEGFFTDEPQNTHNGFPWSFIMPKTYKEMYGDDLLSHLPELFEDTGDYKRTRIRYRNMVTVLFSENYMKRIYDWCDERGLKFTGHLVSEDNLFSQLSSNGACMPHYEYFHIPGVDKLMRGIDDGFAALQLGSVAQQLGKKQVITESYALCGHNVSFSELRGITDWQFRCGVNLICPHLEGYSLRGIRKRDYPPAMYEQQPWWNDYADYIDTMSRLGMILTESEARVDTLLMHPQTMAWAIFNGDNKEDVNALNDVFVAAINCLDRKHIVYHLGDEIIMRRHAFVDGDSLVIGEQRYKTVVTLKGQYFMPETEKLLAEFCANGGKLITADEVVENNVVDNAEILYNRRYLEGATVHYFVNLSGKPQSANISVGKNIIDLATGEVKKFDGHYDFLEYDSIVVTDADYDTVGECEKAPTAQLDLSGEWYVKGCTENIITLDMCDYYFDGVLQERDGYVLNIQERACNVGKPIKIKQDYKVNVKAVPETVYLACETPEIFDIFVNGTKIDKIDCGFLRDRSFRKFNIGGLLKTGENVITVCCDYKQSDTVYENLKKARQFESEKNKLTYDVELEPIYLSGNFAVYADGDFVPCERNSSKCLGAFYIDKPTEKVQLKSIEQQGFLFFAGELTVEKEITVDETAVAVNTARTGINAVRISVNGSDELTSIWNGEKVDITKYLKKGKNTVSLTLVNNLRNMMGPHHLVSGESLEVGPASFYKELCIWKGETNWVDASWNDEYCFVEMSLLK